MTEQHLEKLLLYFEEKYWEQNKKNQIFHKVKENKRITNHEVKKNIARIIIVKIIKIKKIYIHKSLQNIDNM